MRRPGLFEELQTRQVFQCGVAVGAGQAETRAPGLRAHLRGEGVAAQWALQCPWRPALGPSPSRRHRTGWAWAWPPCALLSSHPRALPAGGPLLQWLPPWSGQGIPRLPPEGRWQLSPRALWPKDEPLRSKLNPQLRVPLASFMGKSMGHFPFPTQVSSAGAPQGQEHMGNPPCQAPPGPQPERMWVTLHGPPGAPPCEHSQRLLGSALRHWLDNQGTEKGQFTTSLHREALLCVRMALSFTSAPFISFLIGVTVLENGRAAWL